jgi:hypothetical protein
MAWRTIYPNAPDHAIYGMANQDLDGKPFNGENTYEIRFEAGELPPAGWINTRKGVSRSIWTPVG